MPILVTKSPQETHPRRVENILTVARKAERTLLTEVEAKEILSSYGFPVVETHLTEEGEDAVELMLGKRVDPNFGPIILFGAGGRLVDACRDRAVGLPPLSATLAKRLMEQTRIYAPLVYNPARKRFEGYRAALRRAKLPFDKKLSTEGDFTCESGYNARRDPAIELFARQPVTGSWFCLRMLSFRDERPRCQQRFSLSGTFIYCSAKMNRADRRRLRER
jgi:hypothetical protein